MGVALVAVLALASVVPAFGSEHGRLYDPKQKACDELSSGVISRANLLAKEAVCEGPPVPVERPLK